ncbi:MAG: RusA family crossover junction endodeoxyribonuclease [Acidimicrobiales bacterium]
MNGILRFVVYGKPVTQGHKRGFINRSTGRVNIVEQNHDGHASWREAVRAEAQRAVTEAAVGLIEGPVCVSLFFGVTKPKSAPKKRPTFPIGKVADVDTLARCVLDSLSGVVFGDDGQVTVLKVNKDYTARPGVVVEIRDGTGLVLHPWELLPGGLEVAQ